MRRRGFLSSILALGAAPAIVRAGSLMRIAPPRGYELASAGDVTVLLPSKPAIGDVVSFEVEMGRYTRCLVTWNSAAGMGGKVVIPRFA